MSENKLCCRIFPIVLIILSTVIAAAIWYFEDGVHEFSFLRNSGELIPFLGTVLFVVLIPIGLFYFLNDKEKYEDKARLLALLGFIPALAFLLLLIV